MIDFAIEKEKEERLFASWLSLYPFMMAGLFKFITYDEYKEKLEGSKTSDKSWDEIEKEMASVVSAYEGRVKRGDI